MIDQPTQEKSESGISKKLSLEEMVNFASIIPPKKFKRIYSEEHDSHKNIDITTYEAKINKYSLAQEKSLLERLKLYFEKPITVKIAQRFIYRHEVKDGNSHLKLMLYNSIEVFEKEPQSNFDETWVEDGIKSDVKEHDILSACYKRIDNNYWSSRKVRMQNEVNKITPLIRQAINPKS